MAAAGERVDVVIVGAGPNGLVAACLLADAGWDVVLFEDQGDVGGAARSVERPAGVVTDLFSAFYPLAAASPVLRSLELQNHGLAWEHAPLVLSHPDEPAGEGAALLSRDPAVTAAGLDAAHAGDGDRWLSVYADYQRIRDPLLAALFRPFPPVRAGLDLARTVRVGGLPRFARSLLLPARRMGEELFGGERARALLAGNACHGDAPVTAPGSGVFGWILAMLAQDVGFPVPRGGAGRLTAALASRARASGVQIRTGTPVERIVVSGGRALGVVCADGTAVRARRGVLAALDVRVLADRLLPADATPVRWREDLTRMEGDTPVVKVNWTLPGPVPWRSEGTRQAGTVHLGADTAGLVHWNADLDTGRVPERPFMLIGQMALTDRSRACAPQESLWAYTHLPRGTTEREVGQEALRVAVDRTVAGMERVLNDHAPGFADGALDRFVQGPRELVDDDASLVEGGVNGGTAQLHQQLVFRPTPGLGRATLPVDRLYLAGASAHPGGGVHGAPGANAALTVLRDNGWAGPVRRAADRAAWRQLLS